MPLNKPIPKPEPILKRIKVNGFKSIVEIDLLIKKNNILIGANGAGKSNLISLFTFLNNLAQGKLKPFVADEGGADSFFHFGSKITNYITIDFELGSQKGTRNGYHVQFSHGDDDSLYFEKEYCTINTSSKLWELNPENGESGLVRNQSQQRRVQMFTLKYLQQCKVFHFHETGKNAKFKLPCKITDGDCYLERDAGNLALFLYRLKTSEKNDYRHSYKQIVFAIQSVAPFFEDFYLEPSSKNGGEEIILRWKQIKHDTPLSANTLSDGTARFICLATLILQPASLRPGTIILDEPELGLHPAALFVLADCVLSSSDDTQFICSTQSVTFANYFPPEDFILADFEEGVSSFRRLERERLARWLENYGMGDIWSKNLIGGRPAW